MRQHTHTPVGISFRLALENDGPRTTTDKKQDGMRWRSNYMQPGSSNVFFPILFTHSMANRFTHPNHFFPKPSTTICKTRLSKPVVVVVLIMVRTFFALFVSTWPQCGRDFSFSLDNAGGVLD